MVFSHFWSMQFIGLQFLSPQKNQCSAGSWRISNDRIRWQYVPSNAWRVWCEMIGRNDMEQWQVGRRADTITAAMFTPRSWVKIVIDAQIWGSKKSGKKKSEKKFWELCVYHPIFIRIYAEAGDPPVSPGISPPPGSVNFIYLFRQHGGEINAILEEEKVIHQGKRWDYGGTKTICLNRGQKKRVGLFA
jgi:hypothetical protein